MKISWTLFLSTSMLAGVLVFSHALLRSAATLPSMELSWWIRVGFALFLYAVVFAVYAVLLRYFDISLLYPIYTGLSILGVSLVGVCFFGESLSIYKMLGLLMLLIGTSLMSF